MHRLLQRAQFRPGLVYLGERTLYLLSSVNGSAQARERRQGEALLRRLHAGVCIRQSEAPLLCWQLPGRRSALGNIGTLGTRF